MCSHCDAKKVPWGLLEAGRGQALKALKALKALGTYACAGINTIRIEVS